MREFHSRFKLEVPLAEARKRFVNRAMNRIFDSFLLDLDAPSTAKREIVSALGDYYYHHKDLNAYIDGDFHRCLIALQSLYNYVSVSRYEASVLEDLIQQLLDEAELDIDVRWLDGAFYPAGVKRLDEDLVDFNLGWLAEEGMDTVLTPYRKGLRHFLEAQSRPELLQDAITDLYEAFEAMIKVVTGNPRGDKSSREEFLGRLDSAGLLGLTKEYVGYAHSFRHAEDPDNRRASPTEVETEAFVYLTGLFLRLWHRQIKVNPASQ